MREDIERYHEELEAKVQELEAEVKEEYNRCEDALVAKEDAEAKVQELGLKQNYKLLDEISILRHRLKELEASNKRKRAKIKAMEQSKFVREFKALAIEEFIQAWFKDTEEDAVVFASEYIANLREANDEK